MNFTLTSKMTQCDSLTLRNQPASRLNGSDKYTNSIISTFFFAKRSGRERYHAHQRQQHHARLLDREKEVFAQDHLRLVIGHARAAKCKIEGVPTYDAHHVPTVKMKSLYVNGHLCSVLRTTRVRTPANKEPAYAQFSVSRSALKTVHAVIFCCAPPDFPQRVFIIPRRVLETLFPGTSASSLSVYLPLHKLRANRRSRPRIDPWSYEDAWYLLKRPA